MSPIYVPGKVVFDNGQTPAAIAGAAPTLDYRFARDKREIETVSLMDKLTFTRAQTCSYINSSGNIELAGANVPRFDHHPINKTSFGLLIEEEKTNLLGRSQEFNSSPWDTSSVTITANAAIAPDGTSTAEIVNFSGTGGNQFVRQAPSISVNGWATCFVKSGSLTTIRIRLNDISDPGHVEFNLSTGQYSVIHPGSLGFMQQLNDNWWRIGASHTTQAPNRVYMPFSRTDVPGTIYAWGAQVESGNSITSYIPTTGAAITRAADSAVIDGTGILTGAYTMIEKPAGSATVSGGNIILNTGYTVERVMVFPVSLSAQQITDIRSAM
jgi:hypothetical protein